MKTAKAEPNASSLLHSMRSYGYTLESALADLIDNAISARAKNIEIFYEFEAADSYLAILDDGVGMSNDELILALRPGSTHPNELREENDLGRYGLGLKTASLSQCKSLSVISKKNNQLSFWTWDLDYIEKNQDWLLIDEVPFIDKWKSIFQTKESGTIVVWSKLDRLIQDLDSENPVHRAHFFSKMKRCEDHLSLVFHRFLTRNTPNCQHISIKMNSLEISPWDPFMTGLLGCEARPSVEIPNALSIKGYILPHRSKLSPDQYREGMKIFSSWTDHQGFYLYRNNRIIACGDWLGLFKNERQYDLCRIKIDINNNCDSEWKIDIKKSKASIPHKYIEIIKNCAKDVRSKGVEVYRKRGKIIQRNLTKGIFEPLWNEVLINNKYHYKINRNNTFIRTFLTGDNSNLNSLLKFIEESIPVALIAATEANNERVIATPFNDRAQELLSDFKLLVDNLIKKGHSKEKSIQIILNVEPFDRFPELEIMLGDD